MPDVTITESLGTEVAASVSLTALTRSDTGLTPTGVVLPLAFTDQGGGTAWGVTFTDPAALPARYDFTFRITWPDTSFSDVSSSLTTGGMSTAYGMQSDVEQEYGVQNCNDDANLSDTGAGVAAVWTQKGNDAASYINWRAGVFGYTVPIAETTTDQFARLKVAWRKLVRAALNEARGWTQVQQAGQADVSGVFKNLRAEAIREIDDIFRMSPPFTKVTTEADVAPSSIAPTRDRYGFPVRTSTNPKLAAFSWPVWGYGWGGGW